MNNSEKVAVMTLGFLKGIINGHDFYTTLDCRAVRKFIEEVEKMTKE